MERRVGIADAEAADLLPTALDLDFELILMLREIIECGLNLILLEAGEAEFKVFQCSAVSQFVENDLDDFDPGSGNPGHSDPVDLYRLDDLRGFFSFLFGHKSEMPGA